MILRANAEEAAERHERVDGLAAHLVDHDVIHSAEFLPLKIVNTGPFDLLSCNQRAGGNLSHIVSHEALLELRRSEMLPLTAQRPPHLSVAAYRHKEKARNSCGPKQADRLGDSNVNP